MFNTFALTGGISWITQAAFRPLQNSALISIVMLILMLLFIELIAFLNNRWHKRALELAYTQLQSMPADYASEIEDERRELSEQKTHSKSLIGWQIKNVLIGLWPTVILIALPIMVAQLHWSRWIWILGWALFGLLAIAQPFVRMVPALATLPNVAKRKTLLQTYTQLEMLDGISTCAMAIILFFITLIARPTSIIILGIITGGVVLVGACIVALRYQKIKNKVGKEGVKAKPQPQKTTGGNMIQFSTIVPGIRRMLVFILVFVSIERIFDEDIQPLIFFYWFLLMAVIFCIVILLYYRRFIRRFPDMKEQAA